MSDVDIKVSDSPIPNAIDQYYSFLVSLLQPTNIQNIALNSTIVTFDIIKNAPLYTEEVFRGFADRTIGLSPTNFAPGASNIGDRFSERYVGLLERLVATMDHNFLKQDALDKISSIKRTITATETDLVNAYSDMAAKWNTYAAQIGAKPTDIDYLDKMIAYYDSFLFANKIRSIKSDILQGYVDLNDIRLSAYPDDQTKSLANLWRYAFDQGNLMARPNNPDLEIVNKYDAIKLAQLWVYGQLGAEFDAGQEVRPSGDLQAFLTKQGVRGFSISKGFVAAESHDVKWSTSGSANYWGIFHGSHDVSGGNRWQTAINKLNKFSIQFANMSEYWVTRGRWFDSTIFDYPVVKELLKKEPALAMKLSYIITSIIIGRGLTLTLTFDSTTEFDLWSNLDVSTGGGFSFFGIGASGTNTYSQSDFKKNIDTLNKTVTFTDSGDNVRLLGFRVEKLFDFNQAERAREILTWEQAYSEKLDLLSNGKMSMKEFVQKEMGKTKAGQTHFM